MPRGIHRQPNGTYRWRVMVGGVRRTGTTDTLGEARRDRAQAQIESGGNPDDDPTVQELLDAWLAGVEHAPTTAKVRDAALDRVPDVFLARRCSTVTPVVVAALWRELAANRVGANTVVKLRNALSRAFEMGVEYGLVRSNPIRAVKPKASPRADEVVPPSPADVRRLIAHFADRPAYALWCRIAATVGARPGEACALRWDGLDRQTGELRVGPSVDKYGNIGPGKNGPGGHRTVDLNAVTLEMLKRHERIVGCPWMFTHNGIDPWLPSGVGREIRRACDKLDLSMRPYDLRHFAASQALQSGESLPKVAKMLGDNPATVARTYAHVMPGERSASLAVAASLDG
jgi:integrase